MLSTICWFSGDCSVGILPFCRFISLAGMLHRHAVPHLWLAAQWHSHTEKVGKCWCFCFVYLLSKIMNWFSFILRKRWPMDLYIWWISIHHDSDSYWGSDCPTFGKWEPLWAGTSAPLASAVDGEKTPLSCAYFCCPSLELAPAPGALGALSGMVSPGPQRDTTRICCELFRIFYDMIVSLADGDNFTSSSPVRWLLLLFLPNCPC